ncbi:peptidoglycan editing factor PgeF [Effusibacillus consociatus]|uniref:Purine nucleoside phosphorylase n=1 Tax=Effusibacillus consociatus TaxID=1117041 RepID=A0ABV9Q8P0_9BACL
MEKTRFIDAEELNRTGVARAVFTTRIGGVSTGHWRGLNLGLHVGDRKEHVIANRELVSKEVNLSLDLWVCGEQVHGKRVAVIRAENRGRGAYSYDEAIPGTDALVTNQPGIVLSTFAADCVPILLLDPVNEAIAAVHAGWKGTKSQIAKEAILTLQKEFGSDPSQLLAAIGPSIDTCCYEVDQQVYIPFIEEYPQGESFFTAKENQRWQLSLPAANRQILLEAGLLPEHVTRVGGCTACNTDTFFSHRAEKGKTGRHAGLIVLL